MPEERPKASRPRRRAGASAGAAGGAPEGAEPKAKASRPARGTGRDTGARADQPRRRFRPALTSRAAILALVVCAIALSLAYPLREYIAQRAEIAQLRELRAEREQEIAQLRERREELADPAHIEHEARTRLHYQYPDEHAYIVIDGDGAAGSTTEEGADSAEPWFTTLWRSVLEADSAAPNGEDAPHAPPPPGD